VSRLLRIAVIAGDGIGPEVIEAAIPAIEAAARHEGAAIAWERLPYGADHYLKTGETLPDSALAQLRTSADAIFLGAVGDPRVPGNEHTRDILLGLRFKLDLYVNFRPCTLLAPDLCPLKPADWRSGGAADRVIDFVIFRENTEGLYLGRGSSRNVGTPEEEQIAEEVNTAPGVTRIIRAAFEWAGANGKSLVTLADKSNAVPAHRLWRRLFEEVGARFPGIRREAFYIDALAMELVRAPERFQVIVTNNMFGDILSDLGAQLVGGLGLAASANVHPGRPGLFEPVHGSAPTIAGKGIANPLAAILTGGLMLEDLGLPGAGRRLEQAVRAALAAGIRTVDLGGSASTLEVARWVADRVTRPA
jgi:3-isopropylmalate dehydrogenase